VVLVVLVYSKVDQQDLALQAGPVDLVVQLGH